MAVSLAQIQCIQNKCLSRDQIKHLGYGTLIADEVAVLIAGTVR